eukprot:scaffold176391_cov31-Tisochrysis_lutea.AAC.3
MVRCARDVVLLHRWHSHRALGHGFVDCGCASANKTRERPRGVLRVTLALFSLRWRWGNRPGISQPGISSTLTPSRLGTRRHLVWGPHLGWRRHHA